MKVHGRQVVHAPPAAVFDAICDPGTLLRVIPGCRDIARGDDDAYRGEIALRLPGLAGTYRTLVRVDAAERPSLGRLAGEVNGALGSLRGRATFRLTAIEEGTAVDYEGEASIGGPLARLDGRFVEGLAAALVGQGLAGLDAQLRSHPSAGPDRPPPPTSEGSP